MTPVQTKASPDPQPAENEKPVPTGIRRPRCNCAHCPVLYTRHMVNSRIMRRRQCRHCGRKFSTIERVP
ncbi:MAG: hypothetical protein JW818_20225 [Pirellulales bacterium]|nr:hypothetical protein [Pirellulales bacterium]